jgi:hypothetical protein
MLTTERRKALKRSLLAAMIVVEAEVMTEVATVVVLVAVIVAANVAKSNSSRLSVLPVVSLVKYHLSQMAQSQYCVVIVLLISRTTGVAHRGKIASQTTAELEHQNESLRHLALNAAQVLTLRP